MFARTADLEAPARLIGVDALPGGDADGDKSDNRTAYKLLVTDVTDGSLHVVPRGLMAAGNVMQGGRGGVDLPRQDIERVKSHLARYHAKLDEQPPWER